MNESSHAVEDAAKCTSGASLHTDEHVGDMILLNGAAGDCMMGDTLDVGSATLPPQSCATTPYICGLCGQFLRDARLLNCLHSFCYSCITAYRERQALQPSAGSGSTGTHSASRNECSVACPVCGVCTAVVCATDSRDLSSGGAAASRCRLYSDWVAQNLCDVQRLTAGRVVCVMCADTAPSLYCTCCGGFYCQCCSKKHEASRVMPLGNSICEPPFDEMIDVSEIGQLLSHGNDKEAANGSNGATTTAAFTQDTISSLISRLHRTVTCYEHGVAVTSNYCETCCRLVCPQCTCVSSRHHVTRLSAEVDADLWSGFMSHVNKAKSSIHKADSTHGDSSTLHAQLEQLSHTQEQTRARIDAHHALCVSRLQHHHAQTLNRLERTCSERRAALRRALHEAGQRRSLLARAVLVSERVIEHANTLEMLSMQPAVMRCLDIVQTTVASQPAQHDAPVFVYTPPSEHCVDDYILRMFDNNSAKSTADNPSYGLQSNSLDRASVSQPHNKKILSSPAEADPPPSNAMDHLSLCDMRPRVNHRSLLQPVSVCLPAQHSGDNYSTIPSSLVSCTAANSVSLTRSTCMLPLDGLTSLHSAVSTHLVGDSLRHAATDIYMTEYTSAYMKPTASTQFGTVSVDGATSVDHLGSLPLSQYDMHSHQVAALVTATRSSETDPQQATTSSCSNQPYGAPALLPYGSSLHQATDVHQSACVTQPLSVPLFHGVSTDHQVFGTCSASAQLNHLSLSTCTFSVGTFSCSDSLSFSSATSWDSAGLSVLSDVFAPQPVQSAASSLARLSRPFQSHTFAAQYSDTYSRAPVTNPLPSSSSVLPLSATSSGVMFDSSSALLQNLTALACLNSAGNTCPPSVCAAAQLNGFSADTHTAADMSHAYSADETLASSTSFAHMAPLSTSYSGTCDVSARNTPLHGWPATSAVGGPTSSFKFNLLPDRNGDRLSPVITRANSASVGPMQIRSKFGYLGTANGQLNSPHGFCLGIDEEIVVADTHNHRIQAFDHSGALRFMFGVSGKDEGQLWFPRKVAVIRPSGRYVVCDRGSERSRMQVFSRCGEFIRKISIRYIDIVAGLAISPSGYIVLVDSVTPTVFVLTEQGALVKWFDCANYMREPSDIALINNEFYICDFKNHCVCVFDVEGHFIRRLGSESVTNFPNGIDVSDQGDILVGDSHGNKFHVSVFNCSSGQLLFEFECPQVKVSRCCGLKLTSKGYIITIAKNNHHVLVLNTLYIP